MEMTLYYILMITQEPWFEVLVVMAQWLIGQSASACHVQCE